MSYPPQDPYGAQSGPYGAQSGQYPSGSYPSGQYPPQNGSDDFWRHVAGNQPPMPPPKKSRTGLIVTLVGVGVLAVVGFVALIIVLVVNSGGKQQVEAGDCISLVSDKGGEQSEVGCGTADSDYKVANVRQGTDHEVCGDDYSNVIDGKTYCIQLDVKVGDCLTRFDESVDVLPLKIDCGKAEDQVTKVDSYDGVTKPEEICDERDGHYTFKDRIVCFGDVKGS